MNKFEYTSISFPVATPKDDFLKKLNEMGLQGWELVSTTPIDAEVPQDLLDLVYYEQSATSGIVLIFKRVL